MTRACEAARIHHDARTSHRQQQGTQLPQPQPPNRVTSTCYWSRSILTRLIGTRSLRITSVNWLLYRTNVFVALSVSLLQVLPPPPHIKQHVDLWPLRRTSTKFFDKRAQRICAVFPNRQKFILKNGHCFALKKIKAARLPLGSVDRHCRIIMALIQLTFMSKMFKSKIWTYCDVSELPVL